MPRNSWKLLVLGILASCQAEGNSPGPATRSRGDHRKVFTGQSFEHETELQSNPSPSLFGSGFDSERAWSGKDDWEPCIAVDPRDGTVYQLTTRFETFNPKIAIRRSDDAGATWALDTLIPDTGTDQNDPQIAVARDGTVYVVWLDHWMTRLIKSSDRGVTWTPPVDVNIPPPQNSDHGWLTISPNGKHVYVGYNWSHSYIAVSHDFGQTFEPPVKTNNDSRSWFHSGAVANKEGEVYLGAVDYRGTLLGRSHINVLRSIDRGKTWTTQRIDTSEQAPDCDWAAGCYQGFLGPFTGIAMDSDSNLLLVYNLGLVPDAPQRIYVRSSVDGVNWSERIPISSHDVSNHNAFPCVAAGPNPGDFRVVWQGTIHGNERSWNTWYRRTLDGGMTWSDPVRLSDRSSGAPYKHAGGYLFPYGDYLGLAVAPDGLAHVVWGEGRSWVGPGSTWATSGR